MIAIRRLAAALCVPALVVAATGCGYDSSYPDQVHAAVEISNRFSSEGVMTSVDRGANNEPTGIAVKLTGQRALLALDLSKSVNDRQAAFEDIRQFADSLTKLRIVNIRFEAERSTNCGDFSCPVFTIAKVQQSTRGIEWVDVATELKDYEARSSARQATDAASAERRSLSGLNETDQYLADSLADGSHRQSVFSRSGGWTAQLCGMSDDRSVLGHRSGELRLRIWRRLGKDWKPTQFSDNYSGAFQPLHLKCADVRINSSGTFFVETSAPRGVNFRLTVKGGGKARSWKNASF